MRPAKRNQLRWEDVDKGDEITPVTLDVTFRHVIMTPGATWDYFPGHHDPEYARAQGQPTIYLNTMTLTGFVDRVATDWAGPAAFITRRKIALRRSVFAGDVITGRGSVTAKRREDGEHGPRHLVDVDLEVRNADGDLCCPASLTLSLPARAPEE
jgi:acyl dehydratase